MPPRYDAVLEAELDALRRITAGEDVSSATRGPIMGPDIRRRYGVYLTSQSLGNGGFIHGANRGPGN